MLENLLVHMSHFALWLLLYVCFVYLIACIKKDNSVMDIAYGPAFFICAGMTLITTNTAPTLSLVCLSAIGLWSARLAIRIGRKNWRKPEDIRYATWRQDWSKLGVNYFYIRSFLQINLLQCLIIFIVALPFIVSLSDNTDDISIWSLLGIIIFLLGFIYESLADWQLDKFLKRKKLGLEISPIMTTGLFRYSRRPNYFGESLIWWGLAIMVLPLPLGYLTILSPVLITYVVTKITGPMLENIFLQKFPTEYKTYQAKTNYFIPGLPR